MNAQRNFFHESAPTFDEVMSVFENTSDWVSRARIASRLGRSKSPALIAAIEMLVVAGYLTKRTIELPNKTDYFQYAMSQKWIDQAMPF